MRKQPSSLFEICVKNSVEKLISACEVIDKRFPLFLDKETNDCQLEILRLRGYVTSIVPGRLFDVFCSRRLYYNLDTDMHVFTRVMIHPHMTVLRQYPLKGEDIYIRIQIRQFWKDNLPKLTNLVVIDLPRICTDEILQIIGGNCPLLEELKTSSTQDHDDEHVTDWGLYRLINLKRLRILQFDFYKEELTQYGIIAILERLPNLEELKMQNASQIVARIPRNIGSLALKAITINKPRMGEITEVAVRCPLLNKLTLKIKRRSDSPNRIIKEISHTDLELHKLNLKEFYVSEMIQILECKGSYLTHFYFYTCGDICFDSLCWIDTCCPHLQNLYIEGRLRIVVPESVDAWQNNFFSKLKRLELGYTFTSHRFCIKRIISFLLKCLSSLQSIMINIKTLHGFLDVDEMFTFLINNGYLENIEELWLSPWLKVSKNVIISIVSSCEKLRKFAYGVDIEDDDKVEVDNFIKTNNLDIEIMTSSYHNDRFSPRLDISEMDVT